MAHEDTNLELRSFEFGTPLHHALFDGEHDIFELLISIRANVNSLNLEKDFLLHFCVADDEKLVSAKIEIEIAISNKKLSSMKSMMFHEKTMGKL